MGTEAGNRVRTVDLPNHSVEGALEICHGDALVHHQTFDLVEHGGVGGIHLVLAVDAAGGDHADGHAVFLHGTDLHGRGLGAQQGAGLVIQVEGVGPFPGGMVVGSVELGEVIVGLLNLGTVHDLKAHVDEDLFDLIEHGVHGMLVADGGLLAGDGDVQSLILQFLGHGLLGQHGGLGFHGRFHRGADLIGQLSHDGAFFRRELAHLLQNGGQLALLAQILDPQRFQRSGVLGRSDGSERLAADGFQLFFHMILNSFSLDVVSGFKKRQRRE